MEPTMDFELSEELAEVQKLARDFSEKEIAPNAAKDDREHVFRKDLVAKMGELGFYGCLIPEAYGGNGLGFLAHALISEEIARVHSAIRVYCEYAGRSRRHALRVRQRPTEETISAAAVERRIHRLIRHHRARCRLGCGGDENHRQARRQQLSRSTAPKSGSPTPRWPTSVSSSPTPIAPRNIAACRLSTST